MGAIHEPGDVKGFVERSLYEIQCTLNTAGATDLVIDIVISEPSREIFIKAMHLAKALLHEGNGKVCLPRDGNSRGLQVQDAFYKRLKKKDIHEPFFKAISLRIQTAQNKLKSDMLACTENKPKGGEACGRGGSWGSGHQPLVFSVVGDRQ